MKLFNSMQIVTLFAAFPFLLQWLYLNEYIALLVILGAAYGVGFIAMIISIWYLVSTKRV